MDSEGVHAVSRLVARVYQCLHSVVVSNGWVCAVALLGGLGLWMLWTRPLVYEVWLSGRLVATGLQPEAMMAVAKEEAYAEMGREIVLEAQGSMWRYRLSELGLVLAPEWVDGQLHEAARALSPLKRRPWSRPTLEISLVPSWDTERLEAALMPVRASIEKEAANAQLLIQNHRPVMIPQTDGVIIETQSVLSALQHLDHADHLMVPTRTQSPAVTSEQLEALRIKRLIVQWSTHYDPSIPRAENVERAARAFNHVLLKPGEILSYNAMVGPVDAANGWREALVIVGGKLVPGIGGGVCQVATTLYEAALRANLEIMERHPHQLAVPYVAPSQDAAVAQGAQDLKLRNTTDGHLLIEAEAGGGEVTFRLYGDVEEEQEVRIESQVLASHPFPVERIIDSSLQVGEQYTKMKGYPGLLSEAYRTVYAHGQMVKRELLSRDRYLPTVEVVVVGAAPSTK